MPLPVGQCGPACVQAVPTLVMQGAGHVTWVGHLGPASVHPSIMVPQLAPVAVLGSLAPAAQACVIMMRPSRKLALCRSVTTGPWIRVASRSIQT